MPDPAQDPWGVALLGSGVLAGVGLLLAFVTRAMGRSMTLGGWVMGLGLVAFLSSAVAGTHARIRADAVATPDATDEAMEERAEASAAGEPPATDGGETEVQPDAGTGGPVEPATGTGGADEAAADEGANETVEPPEDEASTLDLPADPRERRTAVRLLLREAKTIATDDDDCKDPKKVAAIWAKVRSIPPDVERGRTEIIAKRLETCRRKLVWVTGYNVRRSRVEQRGAFAETLGARLEKDGAKPTVTVSGKTHEKIRVGSQSMTHEQFADLLASGLKKELEELGFEHVIFSDGKQARSTALEPVPDSKSVQQELSPYGLDERLTLPEPP